MTRLGSFLSLTVLGAAVVLGCSGTETGNPSVTSTSLDLVVHSSDPEIQIGGAAGSDLTVSSTWLKLGDVSVLYCDGSHASIASDLALDLTSGSGPTLELPEESICGLVLTPNAATPVGADAPVELEGASLLLKGTRSDGAPFVIKSAMATSIAIEGEAFTPGDYTSLLLGFDVAVWIAPLDVPAVPLDPHGVALVDGVTHPATVTPLETEFALGVELFADQDGDGALDADELAAPIASGH